MALAPDGVPNTFFGGVYSDFLRTLLLGTIAFLYSPIARVDPFGYDRRPERLAGSLIAAAVGRCRSAVSCQSKV
jgi:hypothetical protein